MDREPPGLELRGVSVARGGRRVLHDLSFAIERGEHTVILGPNGSGKSTLMKLLTRECYPIAQEGAALRIFGQDRWDVFALRTFMGIVSGDLEEMLVRAPDVRTAVIGGFFGAVFPHDDALTPLMHAAAERALQMMEIAHLAERPLQTLSTGELRRVMIGRALVNDPVVLVLDEPTSGLDLRAHAEVLRTIRRLAQSGVTIVMVSHDLRDVIPETRRAVVIAGGAIVADGACAEVLRSEVLSAAFGVSVRVVRSGERYDAEVTGSETTVSPRSSPVTSKMRKI